MFSISVFISVVVVLLLDVRERRERSAHGGRRLAYMRPLRTAVRWGRRGAVPLRCAVRCASSGGWEHSQRERRSKAAAAEALAFVQANRGVWKEWLSEKNLGVLGDDPQWLGPAAHMLFQKEIGGRQAAGQSGRAQEKFATRRGCIARVATYNVLCSELSEPDYFTHCDPKNLDAETRYARVIARLGPEMERNAIICLQEVSRQWAGQLHSYFAQQGYYFVMDNYSKQQTGYMGVGIAVPISQYDVVECDMRRVADTGPVSVQAELDAAAEAALQAGGDLASEDNQGYEVGGLQGYALRESVRYGARNSAEVAHDGHMIGTANGIDRRRSGGWFQRAISWLTGRSQEPDDGVLVREVQKQAALASTMRKAAAVDKLSGESKKTVKTASKRPAGLAGGGDGMQEDCPTMDVAANIEELRRNLNRGSPWELAMRRQNVLLFVRLRCVRSGAVFGCVLSVLPAQSGWHNACAFI